MYKIKYLKTKEEFELVVPDPLKEREELVVRISDYDLFMLIRGAKVDIDDDTRLGIKSLRENYVLTIRTLKIAKTKQHLRKLNKVDSSWVVLSKKERKRSGDSKSKDSEVIEYLRENFDNIAKNCVKHDWYYEFSLLCKDLKIKDVKERWNELRKNNFIF